MKTQLHPKIQQKRNQKQTYQILLKRKVRKRIALVMMNQVKVGRSILSCDM